MIGRVRRWWWEMGATFVSRRALAAIALWVVVVIPAFGAWGFARLEATSAAIKHESLARDYEACIESNRARAGIRAYIFFIVSGDGEITDNEQRAIDAANDQFAPLECPPDPDL